MDILGLIVSIISTVGLQNILILLGAVLVLFWGVLGAIAFFIKKSDIESIGPVKFDTDETPKKRRIIRKK